MARIRDGLMYVPPILAWLIIVCVPIATVYAVYRYTSWPRFVAWILGAITFAACLFFGEWLCRGLNWLFGAYRAPKER